MIFNTIAPIAAAAIAFQVGASTIALPTKPEDLVLAGVRSVLPETHGLFSIYTRNHTERTVVAQRERDSKNPNTVGAEQPSENDLQDVSEVPPAMNLQDLYADLVDPSKVDTTYRTLQRIAQFGRSDQSSRIVIEFIKRKLPNGLTLGQKKHVLGSKVGALSLLAYTGGEEAHELLRRTFVSDRFLYEISEHWYEDYCEYTAQAVELNFHADNMIRGRVATGLLLSEVPEYERLVRDKYNELMRKRRQEWWDTRHKYYSYILMDSLSIHDVTKIMGRNLLAIENFERSDYFQALVTAARDKYRIENYVLYDAPAQTFHTEDDRTPEKSPETSHDDPFRNAIKPIYTKLDDPDQVDNTYDNLLAIARLGRSDESSQVIMNFIRRDIPNGLSGVQEDLLVRHKITAFYLLGFTGGDEAIEFLRRVLLYDGSLERVCGKWRHLHAKYTGQTGELAYNTTNAIRESVALGLLICGEREAETLVRNQFNELINRYQTPSFQERDRAYAHKLMNCLAISDLTKIRGRSFLLMKDFGFSDRYQAEVEHFRTQYRPENYAPN